MYQVFAAEENGNVIAMAIASKKYTRITERHYRVEDWSTAKMVYSDAVGRIFPKSKSIIFVVNRLLRYGICIT